MALVDNNIFWSKAGNASQIITPETGPSGNITGVLPFAGGKFDDGQSDYTNANYAIWPNGFSSPNQGLISFWWKPNYNRGSAGTHGLIEMWDGVTQFDFWYTNTSGGRINYTLFRGSVHQAGYWMPSFTAGNLYYIQIPFDNSAGVGNRVDFWIDGVKEAPVRSTDNTWNYPTIDFRLFQVQGPSNAVVDNPKISNDPADRVADYNNKENEGFQAPFIIPNKFNRASGLKAGRAI